MENLENQEKTTGGEMRVEIFKDKNSAVKAINLLESKGYTEDEINVLMSEDIRDKYFKGEFKTIKKKRSVLKGAEIGSAIGLTLGAITGATALTSIVIPGLGLITAGSFAAALVGAGAGSIGGGLIGALAGIGIPEAKTKKYKQAIKEGKIIVGIKPHNEEDAKLIEKEWAKYLEEPLLIES